MVESGTFKNLTGKPWTLRWTKDVAQQILRFSCQVEANEKRIHLCYAVADGSSQEMDHMDYTVGIVKTPCNFGGFRLWFLCPFPKEGKQCRRTVGKLYLPPGGKYFGCRYCYDLAYQSQRENYRIPKKIFKLLRNIY